LVDDLLDVSRITRGRLELRRERVELGSILRQAIETSRPLADAQAQRVSVTAPAEPIYLEADRARLAQVFYNLLHNASKYTPREGHIWLAAERIGHEVIVRVRDNGVGIEPAMMATIFEPFRQVPQTLERSQGGLGIGLTLARRLVDMHGGSLTARSGGAGKGSEFTVRLPLIRTPPPPSSKPPQRPAAGLGGKTKRVLVVDDNQDSATSLATLLRMGGAETHLAHDGEEAVSAAESFRPEVVLLDIGLPKINGYDVCRQIRATDWGKDVLLVALTGWGQDADRRQAREAGFDHHMVKPVDYTALSEVLSRADR
jgi:CheY-like chemotaxis protein/two-component sensor histidine kinase